MINALFSSREDGTKAFELDGVTFGWHAITALYEQECDRVHRGLTRMVPKLKKVHIIRDSWAKLNVTPAKIMQVCTRYIHNVLWGAKWDKIHFTNASLYNVYS